jgi:hypothetical protein
MRHSFFCLLALKPQRYRARFSAENLAGHSGSPEHRKRAGGSPLQAVAVWLTLTT